MIDDEAIRERATALSVPESQIRRDHLLSHLINSLRGADGLVFVGGTALNRTVLEDIRLSEDIDLHLLDHEPESILDRLVEGVKLEYPALQSFKMQHAHDVQTFRLQEGLIHVRLQLIRNRPSWATLPTTISGVRLYYSDLPTAVEIPTPTCESFVAMKLNAWLDRSAPRDLFDLWKLAYLKCFNTTALELLEGLLGRKIQVQEFVHHPSVDEWTNELSHQTADPGSPDMALQRLSEHLDSLGAF